MQVVATSYFDTWANYQVGYDLISQDVATNTSKVKFYGVLNVTGNNISWSWANASVWGASNGTGKGGYTDQGGTHLNGLKKAICNFIKGNSKKKILNDDIGTLSSSYKSGTASGTFSLPKIDRIAVVSAVSDFNDETNPTITFTNPAGFTINAFLKVGDDDIAVASNIPSTGTYTFSLTDAQRNQLRQLCTGQTLSVRVGIRTLNSGGTILGATYKDKTMTLVNANPTFTATYEDTNATTTAITQDDQQIIRNNSTLVINIADAEAKKYATLSSLKAEINGTTYNGTLSGTTGTINVGILNLSSNTPANVTLTDSRGLTTTQAVNLEILDWVLPTAIISLSRQNNFYSDTDITVDASYSSLDSKNTITIKVRSKKTTEGSYGAYTNLQDNVQTTLQLDNNYQWDVQVLVQDKIGSTTYNLSIDRGIPIVFFDRLKRSVGIDCFPQNNTSLEINGNTLFESVIDSIYPVGSIYMSVNSTDPGTLFGGTWQQIEDTFLLSAGQTYTAGDTGGEATHTLTVNEMPSHSHLESAISNFGYPNIWVGNDANHPNNLYNGAGGYVSGGNWESKSGWGNETNNTGGGQAHNNMPPYLVVYVWKRTA